MKTISASLAFGLAFLSTLPAQAETRLTALYAWPAHQKFHQPIAQSFSALHPDIKIDFRAPAQNYDEALQMLTRQQVAGQLPDVAFAGFNMLRELAARRIIKPIDDLAAMDDLGRLGYAANILDLGKVEGRQYGIPFATSTPIVYVNADLVGQAGGDPENLPKNWDDFIALGGKIRRLGDDMSGMYYELGSDDWTTQNLINNFGGRMMDSSETQIAFDSPEGLSALTTFNRFHAEGGQPRVEQRAARQLFTAGRLGFYFASPSGVSGFEKDVGDRFKMTTATLPLGSQKATMPTGGMALVILNDDPAIRKAAWDYIRFATGPQSQMMVVKATGYMPSNELAMAPDLLGNFYEVHPNWRTTATQRERARPWFAWPGSNGVRISHVLRDNMEAISLGTKEPQQALKDMARSVQSLLAKTN